MKVWFCILFTSCLLVNNFECAKILVLFPTPSRSHTILGIALAKGLSKKGHDITMVSPFPQNPPTSEYTDIRITKVMDIFTKFIGKKGGIFKANMNNPGKMLQVFEMGREATDAALEEEAIQNIINSTEKYDAIILSSFLNDALIGLGHHLKSPVILFSTSGPSFLVNDYVGNPSPYSYVPEGFLPFTDRMTFFQRLLNTLVQFIGKIVRHVLHYPKQDEILRKYFPNSPDVQELSKHVALILLNSHISLSYPRPSVPNMIEVGGLHVPKPNPLPKDLQKFMDNATDGVIYFSLGTNVPSKDMPIEMKSSLMEAFAKLKQKVLWKWDESTIPGLSENVRLSKWYPQSDILAHPNVKLFITHGGLLSTTETVVRGVPCVGIPIFADQFKNMEKAEVDGYAITMAHQNITTESMSWAINEVLCNPKYTENVKTRSALFNDQIVNPLDKAVYWVEYVIRHKGAPHLRSAGADLPLYQYLLLDVLCFILLVLISVFMLIYFIAKKLIKFIKTRVVQKKNKKD